MPQGLAKQKSLATRFHPWSFALDGDLVKLVCEAAGSAFATISEGHVLETLAENTARAAKIQKLQKALTRVSANSKTFNVDIRAKMHKKILAEASATITSAS